MKALEKDYSKYKLEIGDVENKIHAINCKRAELVEAREDYVQKTKEIHVKD